MNYNFKYYCYLQNLKLKAFYKKDVLLDDKYYRLLDDFITNAFDIYVQSEKFYNKLVHRKMTLKKRIKELFENYEQVYFVTLTFKDKLLKNTNEDTRHRYVRRYLSENTDDGVANIDFGKTNHREHYHALIVNRLSLDAIKRYRKSYGSINFVPCYSNNTPKLTKYIDKLVNHSFKDTTAQKVIYLRRKKRAKTQ